MGGEMTPETEDDGWIMAQLQHISDKWDIEEKCEKAKQFASQHPVYTLFLIVTMATCCIPVIGFLTIVFGSIIFGIVGFVFFEGTVLMLSTLVLGGVLCFTVVLACGLSGSLVATYYSVTLLKDFIKERFPFLFHHTPTADKQD